MFKKYAGIPVKAKLFFWKMLIGAFCEKLLIQHYLLRTIQEFDDNQDGIISYKEFKRAMEEHRNYTRSVLGKHPNRCSCCYFVNLQNTRVAGPSVKFISALYLSMPFLTKEF